MTKENCLISVIMASYNYSKYIGQAIESVINQTYKNWELIIIDDASCDNSVEIIESYTEKDERIRLIINEKNLGLAETLKKGISEANGEWIAFLESDDIFLPTSLEEKYNATLLEPDIVFTDFNMFQNNDLIKNYQNTYIKDLNKVLKLENSSFINNVNDIIYKFNIIPTFSVAMARIKLLENCSFDSLCPALLDYYLWTQLCFNKFYYINNKLTNWRIHKNSYINRDHCSWGKKFLFCLKIYSITIKNLPFSTKLIKMLIYIRKRLIYFHISKKRIKINLLNNEFIYEKHFN